MIVKHISTILTNGLATFEVGFILVNTIRLLAAVAAYYFFFSHKLHTYNPGKCIR